MNHKKKESEKVPPKKTEEKKDSPQLTKSLSNDSISELEDKTHEPYRNNMKKMMYTPIIKNLPKGFTEKDVITKIKELEQIMYNKLTKQQYVQRGKAITSNVNDVKNEDFRINILNGNLKPEKLITMDVNDMANKEIKKEIETINKTTLDSLRSDWADKHAPVFEGVHKCFRCGGRRCSSKEIQMRSADEPMTIFIRCIDCGNEWKIS